jgi:ketosteroid isomerase-like protein
MYGMMRRRSLVWSVDEHGRPGIMSQRSVSLHRNIGMRGGRSLDQKSVLVCDMVDERIDRVEQYYDDTTYNDEFWA